MNNQSATAKQEFQNRVIRWCTRNCRDFPWRNTENPFNILIAELCLQKTGAEKAESAYKIIIKEFFTPALLAQTDSSQLLPIFSPIGLTHRATSLIQIAQQIENDFSGKIPETYEELVKIKGVGQYIANALLVFAYGQNVPLVDEGIARVYRRVFGMKRLKRAYADKELWAFAEKMLPQNNIREYNWGLLDINALLCKPRQPNCEDCPLSAACLFVEQNQL